MADQGALLIGTESSQMTSVAILAWMYAWAKAQASRRKAQASTRMVYQVNVGETLRGRDAATKSNPRAGRHVGQIRTGPIPCEAVFSLFGPNIHVGCMCESEFRLEWNAMRTSFEPTLPTADPV